MLLPDVNVLVYAHRADSPGHAEYRQWLETCLASDQSYAMADLVLQGFIRVVTHRKVFNPPSDLTAAVAFAAEVRDRPNCIRVEPGSRHWDIFVRLCRSANAKGNLVPDAYLAALAIESGCEWITADRGYGRFPGLRWRHPLG